MPRAGKYRHRVAIQANTPTREASGAEVPSWATVVSWWVAIEPAGGRESLNADQVQAIATHTIRMRRYSGLAVEHRILKGDRAFAINSIVDTDERRIEQILSCTEVPTETA
jgi:SPP1 family predicted phage head-tail adaptor